MRRTDHELKAAIMAELSWTPNVAADQIGVAVTDGAVTLAGEVETYPEKEAATRAAFRVRGVTAVADEIVVNRHTSATRSDADIARDAADAINKNISIPSGSVKATVHDHVITLSGAVAWEFQRQAAHRSVAFLPDVAAVHNLVKIEPAAETEVPSAQAKAKITAALMRNAQLAGKQIDVLVDKNRVTLSGHVSSAAERRQAEHAAWALPGVALVTNHITIEEEP